MRKQNYNRSRTKLEGTPALIAELFYRGRRGDLLAALFAERLAEAESEHYYASAVQHINGALLATAVRALAVLNDSHALGLALLVKRETLKCKR